MVGNQVDYYSFEQWACDNNHLEILGLWDYEKNGLSPAQVGYMSVEKIWFKCPRGLHDSTFVVLQNITKALNNGKQYK